MKFPLLRLRHALQIAAGLLFAAMSVQAQESYLLRDVGKLREFELAEGELHVVQPGAPAERLKAALEAVDPGATVPEPHRGRALMRSAQPRSLAARFAAIRQAIPGAQPEAVLYPKDGPRTPLTRRIATADVLVPVPAGQSAAAIAVAAGAIDVRPVPVEGYTMLHFADGLAALEAVLGLEARGLRPEPQLRRQRVRRFTPNDVFFPNQWHLRNIGQGGGEFGIDANITDAWDITRGAGVTISIVDDGLETTHPDLSPNCPAISTGFHRDFNGGDNNPAPESAFGDEHGTAVGGVAAARGNNSIGVSGAAPESQLVGLRLISTASTDAEEAQALFWAPPGLTVGVSNNSWGPIAYYAGADTLAKNALRDAALNGRGGRGQITVFAGGNSQADGDGARDSNADSYSASRYVVAVGALNNFGIQSTYSQRGANLLVSAPSNDPFNPDPRLGIWTTDNVGTTGYNPGAGEPAIAIDPQRAYTNSFGGTSSSAPLVSGAAALMIAATPTLGWRDVHEILAGTATVVDEEEPDWEQNGGGFHFNHRYGAGMVNATAAVVRAASWQNLGPEVTQTVTVPGTAPIPDNNGVPVTRSFDFSGQANLRVERVEVLLRIVHNNRSDLEIVLLSPEGTPSVLSELRPRQNSASDDDSNIEDNGGAWSFTTTHSWGENSAGVWTLNVRDLRSGSAGQIVTSTVRVYGTRAPSERVTFEQPRISAGEADGTATVKVQRYGDAQGAFTVDVITAAQGTAAADADFTPVTETLTFDPGESEKEITIPILQDPQAEAPETIYLALVNPSGVALGGTTLAQVTIFDDELRPITASVIDATAGEFPLDTAGIVIARGTADPSPLTVNLGIAGTATNGIDYNVTVGTTNLATLPATVTIPALSSSVTIRIRPINDSLFEGAETVQVTVRPGFNYDVGAQNLAFVTIIDDDLPVVNIEAETSFVAETSTSAANFVVRRSSADAAPLSVRLLVEGTARPGSNYLELPNRVEIPGNQASVNVPLQPLNDTRYTPLKSVVVKVFPSQDYAEGFNTRATINITEDDPVPDAVRPLATILSPRTRSRVEVTAPVTPVVASGTARDNKAVTRVFYSVNESARKTATGTTAWTADLTADLIPGPNTLSVQSQDAEGNLSAPATVALSYVQKRTLTVQTTTNGTPGGAGGSVAQNFRAPATVEAGQPYTITATPVAGFVFSGWSGAVTGLARTLTFTMPNADATLTAAFVTDPFLAGIQGLYTGRISDTETVIEDTIRKPRLAVNSCGLIQATVNPRGALTGTLFLNGLRLGFRGEVNGQGRYRTSIARPKSTPLLLDLTLDLTGPVRRLAGSIVASDFTSDLRAERAAFSRSTPYVPAQTKAEYFTFVIPAETGGATFQRPAGTGFGTVTIDATGHVRWTATLPDQTVASGSAPLTASLRAPLFASLYAGQGFALGELVINKAAPTTDFTATFDWVKPANPRDRTFPLGFTRRDATTQGALYVAPPRPATQTVFLTAPTITGTLELTRGNITNVAGVAASINQVFTLGLDHRLTVNGTPVPFSLAVTLDPALGLFTGSFVDVKFPPRTLRSFRGIVLQKQKLGWGGFLGGTINGAGLQTGTVRLNPAPTPPPP